MRNLKMTIQYDGSKYKGWQKLGDTDKTIQGKIEKVIKEMTKEEIEVIGSGRTDAGVHALKQVANFHTRSNMTVEEMLDYFYRYLPEDILVTDIEEVDGLFHSRYHARGKKYLYRIWNARFHNPFLRKFAFHVPEALDIDLMKKASGYLIGEHDFSSFTSLKSKKKSKVRELYSIGISRENEQIELMFYGNGFLYNMVRIITGTLIEVGLGKLDAGEVREILSRKDRSCAGPTVPPNGLILYDVEY
ncbi:MAG: tRNA pseudouridine(38-40) synthase TruA [Bacillota bacterium]